MPFCLWRKRTNIEYVYASVDMLGKVRKRQMGRLQIYGEEKFRPPFRALLSHPTNPAVNGGARRVKFGTKSTKAGLG